MTNIRATRTSYCRVGRPFVRFYIESDSDLGLCQKGLCVPLFLPPAAPLRRRNAPPREPQQAALGVNGALRHRGFARTDQASDDTDIRRGTLGLTFGTCHTHKARDAACASAACATSRAHAWCSTERTKQPGRAIVPARHERRATHVARACVFGSRFLVIGFAGMLTQPLSHLRTH